MPPLARVAAVNHGTTLLKLQIQGLLHVTVDHAEIAEQVGNRLVAVAAGLLRHAADRLRSAGECWYHQLLVDAFDDASPVLANVGRWSLD